MFKKRGEKSLVIVIFIILFLIIGVFLVNSSLDENKKNKVSDDIYKELENNETVAVIIKIKPSENKSLFETNSLEDSIEDQKEIIKDNIKDKDVGEAKEMISAEISEKELKELEQNENIDKISISHPIKAFLQDSVPLINASVTWAVKTSGINITGIGETICVIDTGINFTHPDLIGKNKTCVIDCYNKACVENCSVHDDNGHGTHVAGIAAANGSINGVAIGANLIGVKVLDSNGDGHATNAELDLVNAIDWCVLNRNLYNISVITMSLGTSVLYKTYCDSTFTDTWTKSIDNATLMNISVIAATGNSGSGILRNTTAIAAPACITNSTSVSATDKDDSISSYGHYNSLTDFFAPGTNINSTYNGGYAVESGTSMATPHVAGGFALFRQFFRLQNSRIPTPLEIQNNLNSSGKRIITGDYSIPRIDVYSAIEDITKSVSVVFVSPADNFSTKQNENNFTCNSTSKNYQLTNIGFYLWNSTNNLIYNSTNTITGNSNLSVFNYTFSSEDSYLWNCISYNNQSYSNSNSNFTINYDITTPNISSVSSGSISTTSVIISWTTNENANSSVNYGTTSDLGSITSNSSRVTSHSVPLSSLSSSTVYYYNVTSCDSANNCNTTGTNSFTTSTPTIVVSSSGGGGGGSSVPVGKSYEFVTTSSGGGEGSSNIEIKKEDKIEIKSSKGGIAEHIIKAISISKNNAVLEIRSEPIQELFYIGDIRKFDLSNDNFYDLQVTLNNITDNKLNITLKEVYEAVPKNIIITGEVSNEENKEEIPKNETPEKNIEDLESKITKLQTVIRIIVGIFIIVIIFLLFRKKIVRTALKIKKRQEDIKEHRKKFREIKPKKRIL